MTFSETPRAPSPPRGRDVAGAARSVGARRRGRPGAAAARARPRQPTGDRRSARWRRRAAARQAAAATVDPRGELVPARVVHADHTALVALAVPDQQRAATLI